MPSKLVALAIVAAFTTACSSSYIPAAGPRLSIVMENGAPAYVRDGKKFEGGVFGGDIEEAVHGSPRAEEYAREFKNGVATGFAMTMIGVGGIVGGGVLASAQAAQTAQDGSHTIPVAGLVVMGAGLLVELLGAGVELNAVPHLYDAVNAYNDDLSQSGASGASSSAGR